MEGHEETHGVIEMRSILPVVVKCKGADADEPHERRVTDVLPKGPEAILLNGLEALLSLDYRLLTNVDQAEDIEESTDGTGHKNGSVQVDHNGPIASCDISSKLVINLRLAVLTIKPASITSEDQPRTVITKADKTGPTHGDYYNGHKDEPEHQFRKDHAMEA